MTDDLVLRESHADGVVALRLNRPPMNPLSQALLTAIGDAAEDLGRDPGVKAVVVFGSEKALAAGADIKEFGDQETARSIGATFRRAFDGLAAIPRPVIAGVSGFALGGGMELALACDLRVAAETARFGQPEILLGIIPGAGGTQRLARLVGPARAKELIWSGRQVKAAEALAIGLVDRVVPAEELESAALAWAGELARGAVAAMGMAKRTIDRGLDGSLADGLDIEAAAFVDVFGTDDAQTGVASFLEHGPGKATFSGR
ncbi:MAG: enoyl-CoA hydratase/isomerase family protein [Acidimicrobiia bacterium]|nr:enoyl-CoA hydratase/isomerase family protein [Acidimicrobiia bacterium]